MSQRVRRTQKRDPARTCFNLYKEAVENPGGVVIFARSTENKFVWYILVRGVPDADDDSAEGIRGPNNEFVSGEYLFKLEMDSTEPQLKPPKFWPLTPNGVYKVGSRPCISIGEYHSDDYLAGLGPRGFSYEVANGLNSYPDLGGGLHLVYGNYKLNDFQKMARESKLYNWANNREVMESMKKQYDKNMKKWLKLYPDDYKNPELAGKYKNENVRRDAELFQNFIRNLEWDPEPHGVSEVELQKAVHDPNEKDPDDEFEF